MLNKIIYFLDRIKEKIIRSWRLRVFQAKTGSKAKCRILGKMTLINRNVRIGKNVTFYPNVMLYGDGPIEIGDNVDIGNNVIIYAQNNGGGVKIGHNSMIAANCYIIDSNHGISAALPMNQQPLQSQPIEIGEDVWIAANCQILKGAKIEHGAVIGAGSLVNKHIDANAIAFGTPARVHRYKEG